MSFKSYENPVIIFNTVIHMHIKFQQKKKKSNLINKFVTVFCVPESSHIMSRKKKEIHLSII